MTASLCLLGCLLAPAQTPERPAAPPARASEWVIVPRLKSMGYDVTFREFEGRHELPPDIATEAVTWMSQP